MSTRANPNKNYHQSQVAPVENPDQLTAWWAMEKASVYSPFKVEFLKRVVVSTESELLYFRILRDEKRELGDNGELYVDLRKQETKVWPVLPSTIPTQDQIQQGMRFGFLLLSNEWQSSEQTVLTQLSSKLELDSIAEGGKWPIGGYRAEERQLDKNTAAAQPARPSVEPRP